MKYSELSTDQKNVYNQLFSASLAATIENDRIASGFISKMLLIGNGSALLLLINFFSSYDPTKKNAWLICLSISTLFFLYGLISGTRQYQLIVAVSAEAIPHVYNQITAALNDRLDVNDMQAYGFSPEGLKLFQKYGLHATLAFMGGIALAILYIFKNFH